ncbi:MAG: VanZ family protein [Cyanobacteria bacterium J06600_6]
MVLIINRLVHLALEMTIKSRLSFWRKIWLLASLAAIGTATMSPFNFAIPADFSYRYVLNEFRFGSGFRDYWQNILLFVPWGIGLASIILDRQRANRRSAIILVCVASAFLSSTVETTQLLLPSRVSNLSDVICNILGGILGGIIYLWPNQIIKFLLGIFTLNPRLVGFRAIIWMLVSYCGVVTLIISILLANINLSNWDHDFYLTIGNEATGDRPWNGLISDLYISDRGLNQQEVKTAFSQPNTFFSRSASLIAFFKFIGAEHRYLDYGQHISPLLWQYRQPKFSIDSETSTERGILVDSRQWLQTSKPATSLNQKLAEAGEFSLYLTITTNQTEQFGPARIVTLSDGNYSRNIMLAQEGKDLSLRLRTPITGRNGNKPEFIVPGVFEQPDVYHILVTFARRKLDIYLNDVHTQYSFKFTPATSFFSHFPWETNNVVVNLAAFPIKKYQLIFAVLVITPLSVLTIILLRHLTAQENF